MNWKPLNLAAPEYAQPSEPPSVCGLIYRGKRHLLSGPPEASKTLLALIVALEEIRAGSAVAFIHFESGPAETRRLLEDLGATADELAAVLYYEPDGPPDDADIDYIVGNACTLAIIDALAGAYDASGLDDNKRVDIEKFSRAWIRPLWHAGLATRARARAATARHEARLPRLARRPCRPAQLEEARVEAGARGRGATA